MLLVWSVLCKPKAMVGGDTLCHIPQGPLKYRPSDKCLEEGAGAAVTAVGSQGAVGCWELRPRRGWFEGTSSRTSDTLVPEHGLSANSQHGAPARGTHVLLDTARKPSGRAHSCGEALAGSGKPLAANPMKRAQNRLV